MRLRKEWGTVEPFNLLTKELQASEQTKEKWDYVGGRTTLHFLRLVSPPLYYGEPPFFSDHRDEFFNDLHCSFSKEFVSAWLNYVVSLKKTRPRDSIAFSHTIGLEGEGTVFFWSIAPYVYSGLQTLGLSHTDTMDIIFNWVRAAYQRYNKGELRRELGDNHFQGRELLWNFGVRRLDYPLGYDERCPSHLFYRLIAMQVSKLLKDE